MIAQSPIDWVMTLEHSVTIGVILFCGYGLSWIAIRLFGKEGYTEKMNETLGSIKDLIANQQIICTRHAGAMNEVCAVQQAASKQIDEAIVIAAGDRKEINSTVSTILDHTTKMDMWQRQNVNEFRAVHAFDAILSLVNSAERIAEHLEHGDTIMNHIRQAKVEIIEIKSRMQRDE